MVKHSGELEREREREREREKEVQMMKIVLFDMILVIFNCTQIWSKLYNMRAGCEWATAN